MFRNNSAEHTRKVCSFHQKCEDSQLPTSVTRNPSQMGEYEDNVKSRFVRKKMFNVESCKFMSLKNINADGSTEPSMGFDPVLRLKDKIDKMEDVLAKVQRSYVRKIKNLGKKFNKQCQTQIRLMEEVMQLKNELKKNKKAIAELKSIMGKQNLKSPKARDPKTSSSKKKLRHFNSPFHKHSPGLAEMRRNVYQL